eukprot:TRINITY_DN1574_c0_g1_i1.p1 TRINITY_DN1574_c0_g1~~TRINITY_DN1574_c0_g1_i1.p1  ORF type:complete len:661 (-),score=206.43 TRINITY_DN1574_c0_g1_i1:52-1782(-)
MVNSSSRYATIPQSPIRQQWSTIGSTITVEFWIMPNTFPSDPDGKWDPSYRTTFSETQFLPLLTRHIGFGFENQWSHFFSELIRLPEGLTLVVYAGCGCAAEPQISSGRQYDLRNCGYGYVLNSDNPQLAVNGTIFRVPTEKWTHVAFSLDGDNGDPTKSRMARLYINGKLLISNKWADPENQPSFYNSTVCVDKPLQWFRTTGLANSVRVGFFQNQDFNLGRVVNSDNPDFNFYGFNGTIDEIRIWRTVRTPQQIADYYDLALSAREIDDPALVAYYKFNSKPQPGVPFFYSVKDPADTPAGVVVTNEPDSSSFLYRFWNASTTKKEDGLIINVKVFVAATLIFSPRPVVNNLTLPGADYNGNSPIAPILSTSFGAYDVEISGFSSSFGAAVARGEAVLTVAQTGSPAAIGTRVSSQSQVNLVLYCNDTICSNLGGTTSGFPFREFFISYKAIGQVPSNISAKLFLTVYPDCDGIYDACGVCNGDNRTCQCIFYHEFRNTRMSYVLLTFMIDLLIEKSTTTADILEETLEKIDNYNFTAIFTPGTKASDLASFYNLCLTPYCQALDKLLNALKSS